jgi:hypothetical protein
MAHGPRAAEAHLAMAERYVVDGERHVDRQRELIGELKRDGHDTVLATQLLRSLEESQALHIADRDRLRKVLADIYRRSE